MSDTSSTGPLALSPEFAIAPIALAAYPAGTPVYINGSGQAVQAKADALATAAAVGVLQVASQAGKPCTVQFGSGLTLTDKQWQAVVDTAPTTGLTPGAQYYVSDVTAGKLTVTKTSTGGHYVAGVGIALSATTLFIQKALPILEGSA